MAFINKDGLQHLTNQLVRAENIKVASLRGSNIKEVIDNIQREFDNVAQPNTMIIENNVSEFKIGKGRNIDVSGDVEEGRVEVELKGRTFQNLLTNMQPRYGLSYRNGIYTFEASKSVHVGFNTNNMLKNNTTYSIIIEFLELPKNIENIPLFGTNEYGTTKYIYNPIINKKYVVSATTRDTPVVDVIYLSVRPNTIRENIRFKAMLLEGDYTQTPIEELPEFFEGIKSSFENKAVDIEVTGKNLFNNLLGDTNTMENIQAESIDINNNSFLTKPLNSYKIFGFTDPQRYNSNTISIENIEPNTFYTLSFEARLVSGSGDINYISIFGYRDIGTRYNSIVDFNGFYGLKSQFRSFTKTVKSTDFENLKYFALNAQVTQNANNAVIEFKNIQITKLNYTTPFEPYNKKKISFDIGEPLRSLPNGVKDEIVNNNGEWQLIRRIGVLTLDSDNITTVFKELNYDYGAKYMVDNVKNANSLGNLSSKPDTINCICDLLPSGKKIDVTTSPTVSMVTARSSNNCFYFCITEKLIPNIKNDDTNGSIFKNWLIANTPTIHYELATPTITPIEPIEFDIKPLSTMSIKSDIAPTSTHTVILNRSGQIEQGIELIAKLRNKIDNLEREYDNNLLNTQLQINNLKLNLKLKGDK